MTKRETQKRFGTFPPSSGSGPVLETEGDSTDRVAIDGPPAAVVPPGHVDQLRGWFEQTQRALGAVFPWCSLCDPEETCDLASSDPQRSAQKGKTAAETRRANLSRGHQSLGSAMAQGNEAVFGDIPRAACVIVWRIEDLAPVRQPTSGTFYSGDSYLVLHSYEQSPGKLIQNIHFWVGANSSQDEFGAAAFLATDLDGHLGGTPTIYREVQGEESDEFLQVFAKSGGVRYAKGGVKSGFTKVSEEEFQPVLFCVHGSRGIRISEVALDAKCLNSADCFVLDLKDLIIQWNGATSKPKTRLCALNLATQQRDDVHGGGGEAKTISQGDTSSDAASAFFSALSCSDPSSLKIAERSTQTRKAESPAKLFKVGDSCSPSPVFKELTPQGALTSAFLEEKEAFVLQGGGVVYVWLGKKCDDGVRKNSMGIASAFLAEQKLKGTTVKVVKSGLETPIFKQFFPDWVRVMTTAIPKAGSPTKLMAAKSQSLDGLLAETESKPEESAMAAAVGKLSVWLVRDFQLVEWPQDSHGEFYEGDSFVILNTYEYQGSTRYIVYFWQGRDSGIQEKGASAVLASQIDVVVGASVQVRVVQNKEPLHFLHLFNGAMIVHSGDAPMNAATASHAPYTAPALYHVKSASTTDARAVQVAASARSIYSCDCFTLVDPKNNTVFAWMGDGASKVESQCALSTAKRLAGSHYLQGAAVESVYQSQEPASFWDALGGKAEIHRRAKETDLAKLDPRLFQLSDAKTGGQSLWFEEVYNFSQDDLDGNDIMLLDAGEEIFLWVGPDASDNERSRAVGAARDYIKASAGIMNRGTEIPLTKVEPGEEPPPFTCHFVGWDASKEAVFQDPYQAKLEQLNAAKGLQQASEESKFQVDLAPVEPRTPEVDRLPSLTSKEDYGEIKSKLRSGVASPLVQTDISQANQSIKAEVKIPPDGSNTFTVEQLREMRADDGIDCSHKELYLADEEFKGAFGIDRSTFQSLAIWRQQQAKKKVGIF